MANFIAKLLSENLTIPIVSNASAPRLGIKGQGYIPLEANGSGKGVYIKVGGNKYKLKAGSSTDYALEFSSDAAFTLSVGTKGWNGTIEYSNDNGSTWTTWNGSELSGTASQAIYLRGTGNSVITGSGDISTYKWFFTGKYVTGNIENLLDYQTVKNGGHPSMDAYCYANMFSSCYSLVTAPELPATTLAARCYRSMFSYCESLKQAPELPATTLADYCYDTMFFHCTSLVTAPSLPATILADYCYYQMLEGCTSLTTAPKLPATTLYPFCYYRMFCDCTSLVIPPKLSATTLANSCCRQMFNGCTSLTTPPELPATTLANNCYYSMFNGCTSLTTVPELPAMALVIYCYRQMFQGCSNIKLSETQTGIYQYPFRIPTSGTGTTVNNALTHMFINSGGTFTGTPTINTTYYTDHAPI